jgi:tetratricopeptide (TPR) repeat protein
VPVEAGELEQRLWIALHLRGAGDRDSALEALMSVIQDAPESPEGYFRLGVCLEYDFGMRSEAIDCYSRAILLRPSHVLARYNLGKAQLASGDFTAAESSFEDIIERSPDFVSAFRGLAHCAIAQGDTGAAIQRYRKALEACPGGLSEARLELATVLAETGAFMESRQLLLDLVAKGPGWALAHLELGRVCFALGLRQDARRHWEGAIAVADLDDVEDAEDADVVRRAQGYLAAPESSSDGDWLPPEIAILRRGH